MGAIQNPVKLNTAFFWVVLLYAEIYLQMSLYRFFLPGYNGMLCFMKWGAVVLGLAAFAYALYMITAKAKYPAAVHQTRSLIHKTQSFESVFLVYVFFWYIISVTMSQHFFGSYFKPYYFFNSNDTWMYVTGLTSFLFFPLANYAGEKRAKNTIECLLKTILIPYTFFTAWVLWQFFRGNFVVFPSGQQILLKNQNMLTLSELSHNTLAGQAMAMCGIALYMITTQKAVQKIFYSFGLIIFTIFIALTNSRNYWYSTALMICMAACIIGLDTFKTKKTIVRLLIAAGITIITGLFLHWMREELFVLIQASSTKLSEAGSSANISPRSIQNNLGTIGNRLPLYKAGLYTIFTNKYCFLFGYTPSNVIEPLRGVFGVNSTYGYYHMHNFILQMGMSYGFPTMLGTIMFCGSLFIRGIRIIFKHRKTLFHGGWIIPVLALSILASDMLEAELNSSELIICPVFYLFAGWMVAIDRDAGEKNIGAHPQKEVRT